MWSCKTYLPTVSSVSPGNFFKPTLKWYWIMMKYITWYISSSVSLSYYPIVSRVVISYICYRSLPWAACDVPIGMVPWVKIGYNIWNGSRRWGSTGNRVHLKCLIVRFMSCLVSPGLLWLSVCMDYCLYLYPCTNYHIKLPLIINSECLFQISELLGRITWRSTPQFWWPNYFSYMTYLELPLDLVSIL